MHIYTHGNAEYAAEMAKLLDPTKRFFAERIISQVEPAFSGFGDRLVAFPGTIKQSSAHLHGCQIGTCAGGQYSEACQRPRRCLRRR